ncbi:helix-turn-helix domain-containing protein [Mycobacterium avium]
MFSLSEQIHRITEQRTCQPRQEPSGCPRRRTPPAACSPDPAISLADLAAITGVSLATVHRQVAANALPVKTVRIGQRWIVTSASVRDMLDLEPVKVSA